MQTLRYVVFRDLLLAMRRRADVATTLFFFVIVASLFPLGVGPDPKLLRVMAPGILWVGALLASMLSLGRLFAEDYADGSLEQLVLAPEPLTLVVIGKVVAHWLVSGLPLVLISPVIALQFDLPREAMVTLLLALLLGTPLLSLIGAIGAALTVGVRGGGVLISLLVLPLYVPVLIFGAGAVDASAMGMEAGGHLSILGALLLLGMVLAPWATAAALRISLE
ncbi:heme exporter protein CcmB [Thiobacillus sp.]|uniref:heme exporter protein CcmB n=1 Tax=Thiobacillus sp. TaxID=924 RepID=UPI0025E9EDCF|nr:heme exporter protein CcmB [Thiobacillus sp.]